MRKSTGNYEVGYGKPPDATKFGNRPQPKRRRRKSQELPDILALLTKPVAVMRDGKQERLNPHEVMLLSLWKRAAQKREIRAAKALLAQCDKAGLFVPPAHQRSSGVLVCPKWMPMEMMELLITTVGAPPWPWKVYDLVAKRYAESLAIRAEWYPGVRERHEHEYIRDH